MEPDAHLEEFWLSFKQSMLNFYKDHPFVKRPIEIWSQHLNRFKSRKKYQRIEQLIQEYTSLYAIDVMRFGNGHTAHILQTNIKRWNRVRGMLGVESHESGSDTILTLFKIFYSHYDQIQDIKSIQDIFQQVELFLITNKYYSLIQFAIDYEHPSILDQLHSITDVSDQIMDYYDVKIPKNMCGRKIIETIKTTLFENQFQTRSQ